VLELRHVFFGRTLFGQRPGQHEFCFKYRPGGFDHAVEGGRHIADDRMLHPALDPCEDLAGIALVPVAVERLGHDPELDNEVAGKILGLGFAALLAPEAEQGGRVIAHDDAGVRATWPVLRSYQWRLRASVTMPS
jgi:hypothetical protein